MDVYSIYVVQYMDDVVREVNAVTLGKLAELLRANSGRINQLLFADDTALVADLEEKLLLLLFLSPDPSDREVVFWWVSFVEYAKEESWEWMSVRVKIWGGRGIFSHLD